MHFRWSHFAPLHLPWNAFAGSFCLGEKISFLTAIFLLVYKHSIESPHVFPKLRLREFTIAREWQAHSDQVFSTAQLSSTLLFRYHPGILQPTTVADMGIYQRLQAQYFIVPQHLWLSLCIPLLTHLYLNFTFGLLFAFLIKHIHGTRIKRIKSEKPLNRFFWYTDWKIRIF